MWHNAELPWKKEPMGSIYIVLGCGYVCGKLFLTKLINIVRTTLLWLAGVLNCKIVEISCSSYASWQACMQLFISNIKYRCDYD